MLRAHGLTANAARVAIVVAGAEAAADAAVALHGASPSTRKASLGIMIGDKTCWDRGYGTDAILTILRFAFDEMNLHRVWLQVHDDNARAIACYKKCGFVEEGRLRHDRYRHGTYHDTIEMGILDHEYRTLYSASHLE